MPQPRLIIISGAPASGKTTLGRRIAQELNLPFVGKDDIKEILFDTLGIGDRAWSRKLGGATYELLYYVVETQLAAGRSLIVESNFRSAESSPRFLRLQQHYGFDACQIVCSTDPGVIIARYEERWRTGQRHPGHVDDVAIVEIAAEGQAGYTPMPLGGQVVQVDTTDFTSVDPQAIVAQIRAYWAED